MAQLPRMVCLGICLISLLVLWLRNHPGAGCQQRNTEADSYGALRKSRSQLAAQENARERARHKPRDKLPFDVVSTPLQQSGCGHQKGSMENVRSDQASSRNSIDDKQ